MPRPPRLITELVTLTRSWGWSLHDLAHELGVSYSTLKFYRAGTRDLTMRVYRRIATRFGEEHRHIKDLCWHYATTSGAPDDVADAVETAARDLRAADLHVLRTYVERFGTESIHGGRGLFLLADHAQPLTAAVGFLRAVFASANVKIAVVRADRSPSAADQRDALAAPLLLLERVDFVHDANVELLVRRADLVRPTIVTSMEPPAATKDAYLRRILMSTMRTVTLSAITPAHPSPSPMSHARA